MRLSFELTLSVAPLNFTATEALLNLIIATPESCLGGLLTTARGTMLRKASDPTQHWIVAQRPAASVFVHCLQNAMLQLKN